MAQPQLAVDNVIEGNHGFVEHEDSITYVSVQVYLTPAEAEAMIATLDSNGSSARATRDPLSRAVLEAIRDSGG